MVNSPAPLLSEFLTENETAEQLGVCERTLKRWRALKEGPPVTRIGRRVLYRRATVERWLLKQEAAS
jgi:predicted DNA-binding transcriptional regulator AlpA